MTVERSHEIAERVERTLLTETPRLRRATMYVNPHRHEAAPRRPALHPDAREAGR